ncbi:MAG: dihydroneopterin aldolase [Acidobacteria bacterium]|nr:dihydroneopterin aldolase [Acidobacteriota bacterium]
MDRLTLANIRLMPRIGVTPGERRQPQLCQADVTVWGDFEAAAATDDLERALNYSRIHEKVVESAHAREFNLIETLTYQIARDILRSFPVRKVNVRLRKRPASLADKLDFIEVEAEEE